MFKRLIKNAQSILSKDSIGDKYNILALGLVAGAGHIFYFIYWSFVDPQTYESIILRSLGLLNCAVLISTLFWKIEYKKIINYYWIFSVIYNLPFFFVTYLIKNNFSGVWVSLQSAMIFTVILFIPSIVRAIKYIFLGVILAIIFCFITSPDLLYLDPIIFEQVPVYILSLVTGFIFSFSSAKGIAISTEIKHEKKVKMIKALAGSIAHELRNPLSSIRLSASSIDVDNKNIDIKKLNKLSKNNLVNLVLNDIHEVIEHKEYLNKSIDLANSIIDMTLADLSGKKISKEDFIYIDSSQIINEALSLYAFKSQEERGRIKINFDYEKSSFVFKGVETQFYYILFNLIKNSLYYVDVKPDLKVTISISKSFGKNILSKKKNFNDGYNLTLLDSVKYNIIHIQDTGPGIPQEMLSKLFGNFVTSGKKDGTGLGLAFCKRAMIEFGGDIDCESEYGKWTRFNLYFPQLNSKELKIAKQQIANRSKKNYDSINVLDDIKLNKNITPKKILIADDQKVNLEILSKFIKSCVPNIIIDSASNGKEALDLIKSSSEDNRYDLIITDIQMPKMDGFELSEEIRKFDKNVPISAYTSRTSYRIKQKAIKAGIDDYIIKPIPNNSLIKVLYKWIINNHQYRYDIDQVLDRFKGLRLLIADDESINIMVMKKFLEKYNIKVENVKDGAELVVKYKAQFPDAKLEEFGKDKNPYYQNPNLINKYDIILVDINMPVKKGDEAAKEIRDFELVYNIQNKSIIIAHSGDNETEKLRAILRNGVDDYFIKGDDNNNLLKIINFWLKYKENRLDPSYLNINSIGHGLADIKKNHKILNSKLTKKELIEFRDLFIKSCNDLMKKIKQAKKENSIANLAFHSHALKGVAGNVGAEKLFLYISIINNYAKHNSWPQNQNWFEQLDEIANQTLDAFTNL